MILRDQIFEALRLCPDSGQLMPWQLHRLTDAVLRLLAPTQAVHVERAAEAVGPLELVHPSPVLAQPTGASSDPPDPLPRILPPGSRSKKGDDLGGFALVVDVDDGTQLYASTGPSSRCFALGAIDWAHYRAQQARYVPSVGERAVLVASPDEDDSRAIGKTLTILKAQPYVAACIHWWVQAPDGDRYDIHRDATWRRAQPQGEATTDPAADATNGGAPEQSGHTFKMRVTGGARGYVSGTLPGNARPVEPAAGVASPPRRFATPSEALSCLRETIAEECHQEHPAHDAVAALETVEALSKRVEALVERISDLEIELAGRPHADWQGETNKRLGELEAQARALRQAIRLRGSAALAMELQRLEVEERPKNA
jgi:hypothetical protein